jgi:hypothetical protein
MTPAFICNDETKGLREDMESTHSRILNFKLHCQIMQ